MFILQMCCLDCFFPQQPERLGVLPIKLRGGLGQPPETLHQVPRGSEGMEPVPKWRFHSWNVRFRELGSERFRSEGSIHETLGLERFRSEGSIHEMLGSERFRSQGSIHETLGSVRFRSQGSIHETLGHFSKYGMCLHITCFVFHIACFLLLIICQSEKQFLSTSC